MVPAMLLYLDAEISYRQAQLRADFARSRRGVREQEGGPRGVRGLRRRAGRLLNAQVPG